MRGLHVALGVDARPVGRCAQEVDDRRAQLPCRIDAQADVESRKLLIGCEPADEVVGDDRDRFVAPEP